MSTVSFSIFCFDFWLCRVFAAACSLALIAEVGGDSLAMARELLVAAPSLMAGTSGSCTRTSGIVARGLGCCPGGGIFLDRGLNLCPLQTGRWILYCWTTGADLKRSLMIGYIFSPLQNAPGGFSGYTKRSLMFRPIQNRLVWTTPACGHFR